MAELTTSRLLLRPPGLEDVPAIVKYANSKKIADFTLNVPHPYFEKDAVHFISAVLKSNERGEGSTFAIVLQDTREFIGCIGLKIEKKYNHAEMGYWLGEPFWNRGYVTEAIGAVLEHGFDKLHLHKIYAHHMEENAGSGKVMLKNGMKQEGVLKEHILKNGKYKTMILYGILASEYIPMKSYQT